jgi:hypothetical protein
LEQSVERAGGKSLGGRRRPKGKELLEEGRPKKRGKSGGKSAGRARGQDATKPKRKGRR